jgi:hypothetical protein
MILEIFTFIAMAIPPPESRTVEVLDAPRHVERTSREKIVDVAKSCVGWREATGNNDGTNVDRILRSVGMEGSRAPYCAAFCSFCYQEAGIPRAQSPHSAYSPDVVQNPTWKQGRGQTPSPASIFGIWFPSKGRVAHAGLIEKWGNGMAVTLEANTNPQAEPGSEADRNGEGVWRRWRPSASIYAVKDYL